MVKCKTPGLAVLCACAAMAQQAPAAHDFGHELWLSTKGLASSQNLVPLVAGASLAGGSALFDERVQNYFGGERRAPVIGSIGDVIGNGLTIGGTAGILFFASYRTENQRFRAMSFDLTQGFILDAVTYTSLKYATNRRRPDDSNNHSFPSGHASGTTMAATVISYYYPKATIPAYLVAALTGFSRIEKNRHWLSDVVAGSVEGYIIGRTVVRGHSIFKTGRLQWFPNISSQGFTVNASINLGRTTRDAE